MNVPYNLCRLASAHSTNILHGLCKCGLSNWTPASLTDGIHSVVYIGPWLCEMFHPDSTSIGQNHRAGSACVVWLMECRVGCWFCYCTVLWSCPPGEIRPLSRNVTDTPRWQLQSGDSVIIRVLTAAIHKEWLFYTKDIIGNVFTLNKYGCYC